MKRETSQLIVFAHNNAKQDYTYTYVCICHGNRRTQLNLADVWILYDDTG